MGIALDLLARLRRVRFAVRQILTTLLFAFTLSVADAAPIEPAMPTTATIPVAAVSTTTATAAAAHTLRDVRIRQLPDALRVILVFDRPAPYVVRRDDQQPRLWLDLINTRVDFLAPELSRIHDERLAGIWLRRQTDAMATLEMRLYSGKTKIEDFSLADPPVVIIDLTREDQPEYRVGPAPTPSANAEVIDTARGPVVSARWIDLPSTWTVLTSNRPTTATVAVTASTTATATASAMTSTTTVTASATTATLTVARNEPTTHSAFTIDPAQVEREIHPIQADYDYFPVHAIQVGSQLGQETMAMFLDRRWGSAVKGETGVLNKGLSYLEQNPISKESCSILYLLAEARFQLGIAAKPRPLGDMINFYEQAVRSGDSGELGSFGHWRLGLLYREIDNNQVAIEHLREAMKSPEPVVRRRASLLAARTMIAERHFGDALALLDSIDPRLLDGPTNLQAALCRGMAFVGSGLNDRAWQSFEEATRIDPQWTRSEPDSLEALVEAALSTGRLDQARKYIEFMNDVFGADRDDRRMRLLLLYAEVLAAKGDEQTAIEAYNQILVRLGQTAKGAEVQRRLLAMHPESIVRGEQRYCLLLWQRGEIQQAMIELDRAWKQCLREGIDTRPLEDAARSILPSFMELALQTGHPYDAMEGWRLYGHCIGKPEDRRRCFRPLLDAFEHLGLYHEALRTIQLMEDGGAGPNDPASLRFAIQAARINYRLGDYVLTISRLEGILAEDLPDDLRRDAYEYLARSYAAAGRPLDAAQAWQLLASTPGLDSNLLAAALTESGHLFLHAGMPLQTIELALRGLVNEKQSVAAGREPWPVKTSIDLRLMLAQAYSEKGDLPRATIAVEDLLAQNELQPEIQAQARLLLASCRKRLNQTREALEVYESVAKDARTPAPWRHYAQVIANTIRWDLSHPNWKLDWQPSAKPALKK
ncbi:MAG: hypothetical protein ABFD69_10070 [Candidatus Sumerlaeia bacterium]